MISDKINALLQFVKFLHSNINNFKLFDDVVNNYHFLGAEQSKLSRLQNYQDAVEYKELEDKKSVEYDIITENILLPIRTKILELKICDIKNLDSIYYDNLVEILSFKKNFVEANRDDKSKILQYKALYFEFKKKASYTSFNREFFDNLDKILKELFDFFSENTENEIDKVETVEVGSLSPQIGAGKPDEVKKVVHPKHDPNLWNNDCFELFKYLFDEYYKVTIRQITNIWFYLKEYNSKRYKLYATKDLYKIFIKDNYQIEIKNFDKAPLKWEEKEYKKIDEHRQNFEGGLK